MLAMLIFVSPGCVKPGGKEAADGTKSGSLVWIEPFEQSDSEICFEVKGLDADELAPLEKMSYEQRGELFELRVLSDDDELPPIAGDLSVVDGHLLFTPRYPLVGGLVVRASFHLRNLVGGEATEVISTEVQVPKRGPHDATEIEQIFPTADRLPENLLRFYLEFSRPMSRGEAYQHIHLLDGQGRQMQGAFLELGEELWDPDQTRFTLLLDPGRVKRGLKPREELGPVLEEGRDYTLVVDGDWPDATGQNLACGATRHFHVVAADNFPIDTAAWKIEPPRAGTKDPLVVRFPKPLDYALVVRMLDLIEPNGENVCGFIEVEDQETSYRFTPILPWEAGAYQLTVDTALEDPAGNSIERAFDVDVFEPVAKKIESKTVSLPIRIESAPEK